MKNLKINIPFDTEKQAAAKRMMKAMLLRYGYDLGDLSDILGISMRTLRRRFEDGSWEVREFLIMKHWLPEVSEYELIDILVPGYDPFKIMGLTEDDYQRAKEAELSEQVIDYLIPDEDEIPDPPYDYSGDDPFDATEWERENLKQTSL